jgi:ubiquinone/menaquinone biosynthesis C-methylase UbiE
MLDEGKMLTPQQARTFYDRLGTKQDWQAFYELLATNNLIAHAGFDQAQSVFECGCGTGAFAERLLSSHLPPHATYLAVDSSATMAALARARLARFGDRVAVRQTDGSLQFDELSGSFERFVSNYVLDLLSLTDIAQLLAETHRLLVADGRLWQVASHPWFDPTGPTRDLDLDVYSCAPAPSRGWLSASRTARLLAKHRLSS